MRVCLLLLLFVVGCPKPTHTETAPRDRTEDVYASVVGLLDEEGEAFCTGTMVGDHVLTAAHCVDDPNTLVEVGFYKDYVRATESWTNHYTYTVFAKDDDQDLAVLFPVDVGASYVNAILAPLPPSLGQEVLGIGHPVGLYYSLAVGYVSAPARSVIDGTPFMWTQVAMGVTPGNSGGPLFNLHGEVLGVCSFRMQSRGGGEPHLGGYVHHNAILKFLNQSGVLRAVPSSQL